MVAGEKSPNGMWNAGGLFSCNTAAPTKLIGVEGDFMTSYWVGNALIRNGFKPSSVSEDYISVYCNAPDSLRIQFPAEEGTRIVGSVAEMISIIIHKS